MLIFLLVALSKAKVVFVACYKHLHFSLLSDRHVGNWSIERKPMKRYTQGEGYKQGKQNTFFSLSDEHQVA